MVCSKKIVRSMGSNLGYKIIIEKLMTNYSETEMQYDISARTFSSSLLMTLFSMYKQSSESNIAFQDRTGGWEDKLGFIKKTKQVWG